MAASKAKARRRRRVQHDEEGPTFSISSRNFKWTIGVLATLIGIYLGWQQAWERYEAHWRLESVQSAKDKQIETQMKAIEEKAAAETKALARRAEVGRAWLLYSLGDFRADNGQQWAQVCPALKQPPEVCEKWRADAAAARQEATEAQRAARAAGSNKE